MWNKVKLSEIMTTANTGLDAIKRAPIVSHNTGIKCLRIQDVSQKKEYNDWGFTEVTNENYIRFCLKEGEIILARTGNTIGVNMFINKNLKSVFNNGLIRLRVDKQKCNPKYLFYNMQSNEYWSHIDSIAFGTSTQPNMQIESFLRYEIQLPDLPTQTRIASILSAIDDKIELNRQMNHTLEQMAKALFKKYFVDDMDPGNLPKGWRIGSLEEEFEIVMGQSPPGSSYNDYKNGIAFFQGRTDFEFRFPSLRIYTTDPKRYAKKYDTLLSVRAPVGDLNIANQDCCIGRGLAALRSKKSFQSYCYYQLGDLKEDFEKYNGEGTVFGSINKDTLSSIAIVIPKNEVVELFEKLVQPMDAKIFELSEEIELLTQIRDLLLPKLMAGEINVE